MPEQGLLVAGGRGMLPLGGCCHPGPVAMLEKAQSLGKRVSGFHLSFAREGEIERTLRLMKAQGVEVPLSLGRMDTSSVGWECNFSGRRKTMSRYSRIGKIFAVTSGKGGVGKARFRPSWPVSLPSEEKGALVASQVSLPFLGSLPQDPELVRRCDEGTIGEYENEALTATAARILERQEEPRSLDFSPGDCSLFLIFSNPKGAVFVDS